jgi:hypothetical protein
MLSLTIAEVEDLGIIDMGHLERWRNGRVLLPAIRGKCNDPARFSSRQLLALCLIGALLEDMGEDGLEWREAKRIYDHMGQVSDATVQMWIRGDQPTPWHVELQALKSDPTSDEKDIRLGTAIVERIEKVMGVLRRKMNPTGGINRWLPASGVGAVTAAMAGIKEKARATARSNPTKATTTGPRKGA